MIWAGTPSSRSPKLHPTWPWTPPRMKYPRFLWATCSYLTTRIIPVAFWYVLMKVAQVYRLAYCSAYYLGMKLQALKSFWKESRVLISLLILAMENTNVVFSVFWFLFPLFKHPQFFSASKTLCWDRIGSADTDKDQNSSMLLGRWDGQCQILSSSLLINLEITFRK